MAYVPTFTVYAANGITPIYTFDYVLDWGNSPFRNPQTYTRHSSLRGQGCIISEGSNDCWELALEFYLKADDYEALVTKIQAVDSTILFNTKYILKFGLSATTTKSLYVKRLVDTDFPITSDTNKVNTSQRGIIVFLVNSWA
jgi:hypothetical protein